ncbi:MAG: kelch repeat-containing protein [bacterium]
MKTTKTMKIKNNTGFTIIEMLIAMGCLSILCVVIFGLYEVSQKYTKETELRVESIIKSEGLVKGLIRKIETVFPVSVEIKENGINSVSGDEIMIDKFRYYLYPDANILNTTEYLLYYQPDYLNNPNYFVQIADGITKSKDDLDNDIDAFTIVPIPEENKVVAQNRIKWVDLTNLPFQRAFMSVYENAGQIYCFGGLDSSGARNEVRRYDIATNTWFDTIVGAADLLNPMPISLYDMASCVHGGRIYFFGGTTDGTTATNIVMFYNPSTNVWHTDTNHDGGHLRPLPKAVKGAGCGYLEVIDPITQRNVFRMYIFGGNNDGSTQIYDPIANGWLVEGLPMSFDNNVSQINAVKIYNYAVIFSGNKNGTSFSKIQFYKPKFNSALDTWGPQESTNWPTSDTLWRGDIITQVSNNIARWNYGAININDKLYVLGGKDYSNQMEIFHFYQEKINSTFVWDSKWVKAFNTEFIPREGGAVVSYQKKIYVIGGRQDSNYLDSMQVYNAGTKKTIQINFKVKKWEKRGLDTDPYDVLGKKFQKMDVLTNVSTSN